MGFCCLAGQRDPLPPALDHSRAVILVVGNDTDCKSSVARALAEARGATGDEGTKAGTRIFTRNGSAVVMETVPLMTAKNWTMVDTARLWTSRNSLRKLFGKLVYVVCVIDSTDFEDDIHGEPDFESNRFNWLNLLKCIFEEHRHEILILVNSGDRSMKASRKLQLREHLQRDGFKIRDEITFDSLKRGHLSTHTIRSILLHSVCTGNSNDNSSIGKRSAGIPAPFFLREVTRRASDTDWFGPWGPQYMLLFGRTGSGKSTLAQMLTLGRLDADPGRFCASDGIRGETRRVETGQGNGWFVVDTPGLGEPDDDARHTISTTKARILIEKYVKYTHGTFCHFIYVLQKGRLDEMDKSLWAVFTELFGPEIITNFATIVVSGADQEWVDENRNQLENYFLNCKSFLPAEFLPIDKENEEFEKDLQKMRLDSLKALEDEFASFCRLDASCRLGKWSVGTERNLAVRNADKPLTMRPSIRVNPVVGPSAREENRPSDYDLGRFLQKLGLIDVAGARGQL